MSFKKSILLAVLIASSLTSFCQTLKYDIILLGKKIGQAVIAKKDSSGFIHYSVNSHSDAKILGMDKKDDMQTAALFNKEGQLVSSVYEDQKNKSHLSTKAEWKDNKLNIEKDGAKTSLAEAATFSSLLLYFSEPKDHQKIFSERLGQYVEIAKEKDDKYKISFNDYTAIYTYQSGKITELQMKESAGQVIMKLVE
jgi:hypothetical protein